MSSSYSDFIHGICYKIRDKFPSLSDAQLNTAINSILEVHPIDHNISHLRLHIKYYFLLQDKCREIINKHKYRKTLIRVIGKVLLLYKRCRKYDTQSSIILNFIN